MFLICTNHKTFFLDKSARACLLFSSKLFIALLNEPFYGGGASSSVGDYIFVAGHHLDLATGSLEFRHVLHLFGVSEAERDEFGEGLLGSDPNDRPQTPPLHRPHSYHFGGITFFGARVYFQQAGHSFGADVQVGVLQLPVPPHKLAFEAVTRVGSSFPRRQVGDVVRFVVSLVSVRGGFLASDAERVGVR